MSHRKNYKFKIKHDKKWYILTFNKKIYLLYTLCFTYIDFASKEKHTSLWSVFIESPRDKQYHKIPVSSSLYYI